MSIDFKTFDNNKRSQFIKELNIDIILQQKLKAYPTSVDVVNNLISGGLLEPAANFVAMGLPKRQAAWWCFLIAQKADAENRDINVQSALKISEQWIRSPSEELRRQAKSLGDALDLYPPSAWLAMTIFWSGDNIAPAGKPSVSPGEHMSAQGISGCIAAALDKYPTSQQLPLHQHFLKQGMHIAMGGNGQI